MNACIEKYPQAPWLLYSILRSVSDLACVNVFVVYFCGAKAFSIFLVSSMKVNHEGLRR